MIADDCEVCSDLDPFDRHNGFMRHRRRDQTPCTPSRIAWNRYWRRREQKKRIRSTSRKLQK